MSDLSVQIQQEINKLVESRLTLEMATVSKTASPCASYAPYIYGGNLRFYVMLSDLAVHTANIASNPKVSVMIIEDESDSSNLFARERLIADCEATMHVRGSNEFNHWIEVYKKRFGNIVDTLVQLADFNLYSLAATQAAYIKGFGQAYRISDASMKTVEHITNPARDMQSRK